MYPAWERQTVELLYKTHDTHILTRFWWGRSTTK